MGPIAILLGFPIAAPIAGLGWIARQVAAAAEQQYLDPGRIEAAMFALERRLDAGEIDEAAFEGEEALLLQELKNIRAALADRAAGRVS
jgi:hypothetical protein